MEEWKEYKIGNICSNVCSGGTPSSKHAEYYDGDIPWLNTKEINFNRIYNTEKSITEEGLNNSSAKWIAENSVIVAMYGATAGKAAIAKIPLTTNQACCNLTIDPTIADYRFVYYFLCYKFIELASLANGGAQQNLNAQIIKDFDIVLPSLKEQTYIANLLSSFDDKIEVNRRINENLEQQAQALFKSWFVDFEPFKNGEFVESELGMIPKGWRVGFLGDLLEIKYGKDHKKLADGKIPVYGSGGLMRRVDKSLYIGESVLIPRKGTLNNVMYVNEEFWTVDTMFYTIPKVEHIALFCYLFLSEKDLASMNAGSAVPSMTTEILNSMSVVIPQKNIVNEFDSVLSSYFRKIESNKQESRRLAELRDTLLPKLMSGEFKVNEIVR